MLYGLNGSPCKDEQSDGRLLKKKYLANDFLKKMTR